LVPCAPPRSLALLGMIISQLGLYSEASRFLREGFMRKMLAFVVVAISCFAITQAAFTQIETKNQLAPSVPSGGDLSLTIPATEGWTDTGLDLHPGDVVQISANGGGAPSESATSNSGGGCDPAGAKESSPESGLLLGSAPAGALIAKVSAQSGTPVLVGAQRELKIEQPGHLFLGANNGNQASCQGTFAVRVHVAPATAAQTAAPASVKSKLSSAAQTWLSGQLGTGAAAPAPAGTGIASAPPTTGAAANPTPSKPALMVSTTPLDPKLREDIDQLPRRVNDQLKNLGDMVNFVVIGNQKDVQTALDSANWFVADRNNSEAVAKAVLMTSQKKDYLQMPMSLLYLFGRVQDFGYEMAEPYSVVASRHHFRIWKAPFQYNGQEVWVGAGTHDIGFEKDQRNGSVTHKIDPAVDGERENIGASLQKSGRLQSMWYYLPPNPVQEAKNATGGGYHSDGRILVISLKDASTPAAKVAP
jgi:LssY C-terminus